MNCPLWEERIALHAGGDPVAADVEQHLAVCDGCREFHTSIRETLDHLRNDHQLPIDPADYAAVRSGVLSEIRRERRSWQRLAWLSGVGIAAALVLGIALRPAPLPPPPSRVALKIPSTPLVSRQTDDRSVSSVRPVRKAARPSHDPKQPVLVKLQTSDPNIVIYWIAE
jgi:hypothetical protein